MPQATIAGISFWLVCALSPSATNPSDIDFSVRLAKDSQVYHLGEPIEFEFSYSSSAAKKYQTDRVTPNPDMGVVSPHPSPAEGVIDLRELRIDGGVGFNGSFMSGGPEFLGSQPVTERLDLSQWYRFEKPGHYSVRFTSQMIWRVKSLEEGGGREDLELESDSVEFDILPADPSWEAAELSNIIEALNSDKYQGENMAVVHRLATLDTPAAIKELVDLFLGNSTYSDGQSIYLGLRESSHTDLIISMLQAAITDPAARVPQWLPELLAEFQTRKKLGIAPPYPKDPSGFSAWNEKIKDRNNVRNKYLATADAQLRASVDHRTGPRRSEAIYQNWMDAESLNSKTPQPEEVLSHLREEVLDSEHELDPSQRIQFVTFAWKTMPHEPLLPMIRDLATEKGPNAFLFVGQAFQFWCEDWPSECNAEILRRASESDSRISQYQIFLMPETEHPELDKMFEGKLADQQLVWTGAASVDLSALVLRAGSRNLVPFVNAALGRYTVSRKFMCEPQAYLLGFLFRFTNEDAGKRLSAIMQGAADPCGNQMLRFLEKSRYSDDLVPIAIQSLDSQNVSAAASSALFLGVHARETAKAALWKRLDAFWGAWRDRAGELKMQESTSPLFMGNSAPAQALMLQAALASALANATNWQLSEAERDRLRSGCLTEQCRAIADGKMRLSL
jgi:hypothetical protein